MEAEILDVPEPAALPSSMSYPFVGRTAELEKLANPDAAGSRVRGRRVALLAGEPGVPGRVGLVA